MNAKLALTCVLFPLLISAPATAIGPQASATASPSGMIATLQNIIVPKHRSGSGVYDKQPSNSPKSVNKNKLNVALEDCHRDGNSVTCHLQFTNMAEVAQEINLFADCSRIIEGNVEFGGFNGQIGQSSSATLKTGIARQGFITFQNVAANIRQAKVLEVAYGTTAGDATVRFNNVAIE
jgi:hypothetical protein